MNNLEKLQELTNQLSTEEQSNLEKFINTKVILEMVFAFSSDLICVANKEKFTLINPSFTRVLGWSKEELLKNTWISFVHPDDVEKTLNQSIIANDSATINFENRYRCKNGEYVQLVWAATSWINNSVYCIAQVKNE